VRQILLEVGVVKERVTTGIRTGQTQERETSRQRLRAPHIIEGKRVVRRIFTADYKLSVLAEYDRCSEPGERGALLRREGLYSSLVTDWRRQHRSGTLNVTEGRTSEGGRGMPSAGEVTRLRAENERLKIKLAKTEAIIEVQGKVHALLEQLSKSADTDDS